MTDRLSLSCPRCGSLFTAPYEGEQEGFEHIRVCSGCNARWVEIRTVRFLHSPQGVREVPGRSILYSRGNTAGLPDDIYRHLEQFGREHMRPQDWSWGMGTTCFTAAPNGGTVVTYPNGRGILLDADLPDEILDHLSTPAT